MTYRQLADPNKKGRRGGRRKKGEANAAVAKSAKEAAHTSGDAQQQSLQPAAGGHALAFAPQGGPATAADEVHAAAQSSRNAGM